MERRKFVVGLGSLAAGGAAAMGTGAFSSIRAERTLSVDTAGDNQAYLGLDASTSIYAEQTGRTLELQFDGGNGGQDGEGLNKNADTTFANVFKIVNNGTNDIQIELGSDDASNPIGALPDGPMAVFYSDTEVTNSVSTDANPFDASPAPDYANSSDVTNQHLSPGDSLYVHFAFYLNEDIQSLGSDFSTDLTDVPDDLGIYADSTPQSGSV